MDIIVNKVREQIHDNKININRHDTYFETLGESVSCLTENINMQMESEYADLMDRA